MLDSIDWRNLGILLFLSFLAYQLFTRLATKAGARKLFFSFKNIYQDDHEYRSVDPAEFGWMDFGYYETKTGELLDRGFTFLEDLEDVTLSRTFPQIRTFVRCFSGAEGTIQAGVYDIRPRGLYRGFQIVGAIPQDLRTIDLETEFTDGRFLLSTTADRKMASGDIPPEADAEFYPRGMPLDDFLDDHTARVQKVLDAHPGLDMIRVTTVKESRASHQRLQRLINRMKQGRGYITPDDIARVADDPDSPAARGLSKAIEDEKHSRGE